MSVIESEDLRFRTCKTCLENKRVYQFPKYGGRVCSPCTYAKNRATYAAGKVAVGEGMRAHVGKGKLHRCVLCQALVWPGDIPEHLGAHGYGLMTPVENKDGDE